MQKVGRSVIVPYRTKSLEERFLCWYSLGGVTWKECIMRIWFLKGPKVAITLEEERYKYINTEMGRM